MTVMLDLPSDGVITRATFDNLPKPARRWAWELHDGRLELIHMPVTVWHWQIINLILDYCRRLGHEVAALIHAIVAAVSDRSEENDAVAKFGVYAALGVERYWIVRGDADDDNVDGMITMHELRDGVYEVSGHRLVSHLAPR